MKKQVYILLALLSIACAINGCKKSELAAVPKGKLASSNLVADSSGKLKLTASQYFTTKNIPDTLIITGLATTDSVHWLITPPGYTNILQKSQSRYVVSFETEGTYQVKAIVDGKDTLSASIKVDSLSGSSSSSTFAPFTSGDKITLTPALYKSAFADSTYITLTAQTTDSYPCNLSSIYASWGNAQNNFSIKFMGIAHDISDICHSGPYPLSLNMLFPQNAQNPYLVNGTYPLSVVFSGTTYTGHIIVSSTTVTFDWNYTSGVVFSTKQISR